MELINKQNKEKNLNFEEGAFDRGTGAFMPSEILTEEDTRRLLHYGAYWAGSSWHCKYCKYSYDRPGMVKHIQLKHSGDNDNNNEERRP